MGTNKEKKTIFIYLFFFVQNWEKKILKEKIICRKIRSKIYIHIYIYIYMKIIFSKDR